MTSGSEAGDGSNASSRARAGHVSVFRTGQRSPQVSITLDQRTGREVFHSNMALARFNPGRVWESLTEITPDPQFLDGNGLFSNPSTSPATATFDILRTRVLQTIAKQKWSRIAITSPTHGCGKSFVAANLALSMARLPSCRTVLLDLELRDPQLARLFGQSDVGALAEFLQGEQPLESQLRRLGANLALGLNGAPVSQASELLHGPDFPQAMSNLRELLEPDLILIDTPPALGSDDVLALAAEVDAAILVVDGKLTTAEDVRACERLFDGRLPLLGTVLNRAQDRATERYAYGQRN
ncbi:CpsD/CapB family tyrosine-protein kinase [Xinfangfangia sp. CPCC 101601]|uniref:CpsD/CapB family tyrosine-protein kinase n=1 Tax=Pseudogemmobacter lacusdianii TaxID=3069608 RepID=A0ABU0VWU8_9RHOB|nr:CpsD/CapB family tyrosine-protein kinase [Xinfangfangia sp. CPCC 101601]MDQ2066232.1 CpsD/CapB family tyrosine-protein kinase [Xinfangfangia sp. CPCC 101601]